MLVEMGVAIGVDGHTVGLFQPKKVAQKIPLISSLFTYIVYYYNTVFSI